ncbi:MAG: LCP family protein [Lachnospiraceae bacterium]|nr:LCP family protein [Lachnospiraceae bacterium]
MSKKYSEDENYKWEDEYQWDDSYSEFDDRFDDVEEEEVPRRKTTKRTKSASSAKSASGKKTGSSAKRSSAKKAAARRKKRRNKMIMVAVIEVLLLALVCLGLFIVSQFNKIQPPSTEGEQGKISFGANGDAEVNDIPFGTLEKMEGYTTFAVFGIDKRNMASLNDGLSDVILIVSVDENSGEINMVSVYRDTYLQTNKDGEFSKINAAYNRGGPVRAIEALNTNLDLQIDHYVTVNWFAVAKAIDEMGGVDIEVPEEIFYAKIPEAQGGGYWLNSYIETTAAATGLPVTYVKGPGYQTLNGLQAVALCRIRQVGMDYGRADMQRQVVAQLFEKAKKTNLATLIAVSKNVFPNVQTDMTLSDISALIPGLTKYYMAESTGFPSKRGAAMMGTLDCIIAKDLLTNVKELHRVLYGNDVYVPSDKVIELSEYISRESGIYAD